MDESIFKNKKPSKAKLLSYGFSPCDKGYTYSCKIMQGNMTLTVFIAPSGKAKTTITDTADNEEYVLHKVKGASGSFVGQVREEYEGVLADISNKCFDQEIFKASQTKRVIAYFRNRYGDELEHLWADAPDNAIVRRKDNSKWYAAILTVSRKKLGLDSDEKVEIIDLHASCEDIPHIVDNVKIFPGFHMNKKHWITVCLDETLSDSELFALIDESYDLGKRK